jgi:serine/threonine protein kinase/tetratricopeptide (TPR) repeat protein
LRGAKHRIKELFAEALRVPPAARSAFVAETCGADRELREELEGLLAAHERPDGFLQEPTYPPGASAAAEGPGTRIDHYKLLELIGEGGFGAVYMAEQEQPIRRRVALKLLKLGMDSRQVIARFEAERQALALMDHPNIARVLDAGTTASGRPYFVMELVRGVPITTYCDQAHLSTAERLSVFLDVCHAVQHAHQKGIIHRDLKPSNVLVTLHDGKPVPKVIDFGIAKATEQRLTEKTLFTGFGQMIGTPAYMSPEQAEMSGLDIDTRSDVYSLGVLLYELLAGAPPFDPERLKSAGMAEILRIIKEEEPPRPSTRVSTLGSVLPGVAARRSTEPQKLGALLRGDLDWVVMKALAKERQRRYESASGLARDVQRYLDHEPVSAGPPTFVYRASKFVRRNRVAVGAGLLFTLALVGGLTGTTLALLEAREAARTARANAADAELKFQIAREGADILLNDVVHELPKIPGTRELARDVLDAALAHYEKLAAEKPGDPGEQRRIWIAFQELSDAYGALGEKEQAALAHARSRELVTRAAQEAPANRSFQLDLAVSSERAGALAYTEGRIDAAAAYFEEERALLEPLVADAPDEPVAQRTLAICYGQIGRLESLRGNDPLSVGWYEKSLAILGRLVVLTPRDAVVLRELCFTLERLSQSAADPGPLFERAASIVEQLAEIEGDTPQTLRARGYFQFQRARASTHAGRYADAKAQATSAKEILDRLIAAEPKNPQYQLLLMQVLQELADITFQTGDHEESRAGTAAAFAIGKRLSAADDASVEFLFGLARSSAKLADPAERAGNVAEARELLERAVELDEKLLTLIPENWGHLDGAMTTHARLGLLLAQMGAVDEARTHMERAEELSLRALEMSPAEPRFRYLRIHTLVLGGDLSYVQGHFVDAEKRARTALAMAEELAKEQPVPQYMVELAMTLERLGRNAAQRIDLAEEERLYRRALLVLEECLAQTPEAPWGRFNYANILSKLGTVLETRGELAEAQKVYGLALERTRELVAAEPQSPRLDLQLVFLLQMRGNALLREGDPEGALGHYTEMHAIVSATVARQPRVAQYRASLANACQALAGAYSPSDPKLAREWARRSLAEYRTLADAPDADFSYVNTYAWCLLTCEFEELRDVERALEYAEQVAERTGGSDPSVLDTLALAYFENGEFERALATQERALATLGTQNPTRHAEYLSRLERYRAGRPTTEDAASGKQ